MLSSHRGFLIYQIIKGKQSNQLSYCDKTKKMAHNSQPVRAKENPQLSQGATEDVTEYDFESNGIGRYKIN